MFKRLGRRPSPTTVIACLALFFAVAGGSAIALNGRNTVDSGDIRKGAVRTADLANDSVTTRKIKAGAVRSGDIRDGQVRSADLAPEPPYRKIGAPGNPAFEVGGDPAAGDADCVWTEASQPTVGDPFNEPAFYKDSGGIVRFTGTVMSLPGPGGDTECDEIGDFVVFRLPPEYRPPEVVAFPGPSGGTVLVTGEQQLVAPEGFIPPGSVIAQGFSTPLVTLDQVSFRAGGTGTGLPRRGGTVTLTPAMAEALGFE